MTPADLLAPVGPVEPALFPGENVGAPPTVLTLRLEEYIAQAYQHSADYAFVDPEHAVKLWALHLTFDAAYIGAVARASSENSFVPVLGSQAFQKDQRDALAARAASYAREFEVLVATATIGSQQTSAQSRQTPVTYEW